MDLVLIDDDAVVLFLHKLLIKRSNLPYDVKDFLYAEEALEYIHQRNSSRHLLIFLDINMPFCNGWEFLEKIEDLSHPEKIFVVMVTSSVNASDRQRAAEFPRIIEYLEKPLSRQACEDVYIRFLSLLNS